MQLQPLPSVYLQVCVCVYKSNIVILSVNETLFVAISFVVLQIASLFSSQQASSASEEHVLLLVDVQLQELTFMSLDNR